MVFKKFLLLLWFAAHQSYCQWWGLFEDEPWISEDDIAANDKGMISMLNIPESDTLPSCRWVVYFSAYQIAVVAPPKNMYTTMRKLIAEHDAKYSMESCTARQTCCDVHLNNSITRGDNIKWVVIVRDPFDKVLSSYWNSFINPAIDSGYCNYQSKCTFNEWMSQIDYGFLGSDEVGPYNIHLRTQINVAGIGLYKAYDYVIRMGNEKDMDFLWNLLEYDGVTHSNPSTNSDIDIDNKIESFSLMNTAIMLNHYYSDIVMWERVTKGLPRTDLQSRVLDSFSKAELGDYYAVRLEGRLIKTHYNVAIYAIAGGCKRHLTFEQFTDVERLSSHSLRMSKHSPAVINSIPNCNNSY